MTKVTLIMRNNQITAFDISGHSGYSKHGEDIVCAAISAITQTAELGITELLRIPAKVNKNDKAGRLTLHLPQEISSSDMEKAQILLQTMKLALENLLHGYSKYFKMEEKNEID